MRTSKAPTPSGGTPRASTRKRSRDSMTTATARATMRTRKPDRASRCGDWRPAARPGRRAGRSYGPRLPGVGEGGQVEVDAAGSGTRLLQALDLADDLVDVVAGARVCVDGVVAQRPHVVEYARSYRRALAGARRGDIGDRCDHPRHGVLGEYEGRDRRRCRAARRRVDPDRHPGLRGHSNDEPEWRSGALY